MTSLACGFGSHVGQVANLRPIANRPGAGPENLLGCRDKSRLNRIHFDVILDPSKLIGIANQSVIALVLPKRSHSSQSAVSLQSGESLERLHRLGHAD